MLKPEFKRFYKLNLRKSDILQVILRTGQMELLNQILKDNFYIFNKNHIYDVFIRIIKNNEINEIDSDDM